MRARGVSLLRSLCAHCKAASAERDSPTSHPRSLTVHGRARWPAGATARVSRISRPATYQFFPESVRAGGVAAGDEAEPYRVVADVEDDGRAVLAAIAARAAPVVGPATMTPTCRRTRSARQRCEPVVLPFCISEADITYVRLAECFAYLAVVLDALSPRGRSAGNRWTLGRRSVSLRVASPRSLA
jgi:hypothetical protein